MLCVMYYVLCIVCYVLLLLGLRMVANRPPSNLLAIPIPIARQTFNHAPTLPSFPTRVPPTLGLLSYSIAKARNCLKTSTGEASGESIINVE